MNLPEYESFSKVLIVDDDPHIIALLKKYLETAGYEVNVAKNGQEALFSVQLDPPNFLITDLDMPLMSGTELCTEMRELKLPNYVYTIMLTATSPHRLIDGLESGADDFVCKPIKMTELVARIKAGTRLIGMESHMRFLACHDNLTGLLNRRNFFERFADLFQQSQCEKKPITCAMMDIDRFKAINDRYGHLAGDQVLRDASAVMKQTFPDELMCRYGGEEFAIVFYDCDIATAVERADEARAAIENSPIQIETTQIKISASFGVAARDDDVPNELNLIDRADQSLFSAKDQGRNRVVAFDIDVFNATPQPQSEEEEAVFDTRR